MSSPRLLAASSGNEQSEVGILDQSFTREDDSDAFSSEDEEGSSLTEQEALDVSGGGLDSHQRVLELCDSLTKFVFTSLSVANNRLVNPEGVQVYNDDTQSNKSVLVLGEALLSNKFITSLDISDNFLGAKGQSGIVSIAKVASGGILRSLDISSNLLLGPKGVRYDGIKAISKAVELGSGGVLAELVLADNGLHATGIAFLGVSLANSTLTSLDLSDNRLGVDSLGRRSAAGLSAMTLGLQSGRSLLRSLNLSGNYLGNDECVLLSGVIAVMPHITELDLSFNEIHAVGARHLANALKFNTTVQSVNLGGNRVGDVGCGDIADALKLNESVEVLVLAANELTTASCYYFLETIRENRVLTDLNMDENEHMDPETLKEVMEWVKGNIELVTMRNQPDEFDLSVRSKIVRDCLFIKVPKEDKSVIEKLVSNVSVSNDYDFYERVAQICPPDRSTMLRKTKNLLSLLVMNKEDRAVRLVQRAFRRMKERHRVERIMKEKEERRRMMGRAQSQKGGHFAGSAAKSKNVRAGKIADGKIGGTKAAGNIVVR